MEDAINARTSSRNKAPAMAVEPSECLDRLPDNNNAKKVYVHGVCGISNEADEGYGEKATCRLCHNKEEIDKKKRSAAHFPSAKIEDNVRIRIPDVDRDRGDPRSVLAVVTNVEGASCKLGTEQGVLK
ncbi:hypothetical protein ILUMI_03466 [Ignelater luminosus]|uniref:SCAN domain-containing protein n=1 Tax=Ignelater luminosus TaxID=2038154 RepID=A0A8K0DAR2_IGNLU|nr:hypothetical protein ILUMI_03466 [Ignelater luminosus]